MFKFFNLAPIHFHDNSAIKIALQIFVSQSPRLHSLRVLLPIFLNPEYRFLHRFPPVVNARIDAKISGPSNSVVRRFIVDIIQQLIFLKQFEFLSEYFDDK